jgi:DnaK suppressor protein
MAPMETDVGVSGADWRQLLEQAREVVVRQIDDLSGDERERAKRLTGGKSASAVLAARLEAIDIALGKLDAGTYGRCETCGALIPEDRLAADPTYRHCVACMDRPQRGFPLQR